MGLTGALPIDDWQFWVVTALAAGAGLMVLRLVLPPGMVPRRLRPARGQKRATLTVDGRAISDPVQGRVPGESGRAGPQ